MAHNIVLESNSKNQELSKTVKKSKEVDLLNELGEYAKSRKKRN